MSFSLSSCNKVHFVSLGCPRNLVDSEVMLGMLLKAGFELEAGMQEADFLIVNTCAFLEASREESLEVIGELFREKKEGAKVIVAGCMVTKHKEVIEERFPSVHYMLGSGDVEGILEAVRSEGSGEKIGSARSYLEAGEIPRLLSTPRHFAYLKIAEGCRKACAYCIIPKIKGPLKSKSIEQVVREFKALLSQGVKEIILIAQDLGDFGKDKHKKEGELAELLRAILALSGQYWLRLLYLYPDEITDELIEIMKSDARICPYLDMPIQHINDGILKAMRRHTTGGEIRALLTKLRSAIPDIHIRTSLIVGFPSESEEHFEELLSFVQDYPLNHVGIFPYSQEKGTPAASLPNQISQVIKNKRLERLAQIQAASVEKQHRTLVGREFEVVIEGYHPESRLLMVGRYFGQCPDIDGQVIINDSRGVTAFGERYLVQITESAGYDLIGRVLRPLFAPTPRKGKKLSLTS